MAPKKITKAAAKALARHVESGCTLRVACGAEGITYSTLRRWLREAEQPANTAQAELKDSLARARHRLESNCLRRINLAALTRKHWTAAAWLLQHRVGGDYLRSAAALNPRGSFTAADAAKALAEAEAISIPIDQPRATDGDPDAIA